MAKSDGTDREPSNERRAEVLLERLEPKVQLVLEGQTGLVRRFDEFEETTHKRLDQIEQDMQAGFKRLRDEFGKSNPRST